MGTRVVARVGLEWLKYSVCRATRGASACRLAAAQVYSDCSATRGASSHAREQTAPALCIEVIRLIRAIRVIRVLGSVGRDVRVVTRAQAQSLRIRDVPWPDGSRSTTWISNIK